MTSLAAVDSLDIQVLVDNVTDQLSSVPSFVETEFAGLTRAAAAPGCWAAAACAAPPTACPVSSRCATAARRTVAVRHRAGGSHVRAERLAARRGLGPVEAIVLSHGHWDHAGAMLRALQLIRDRNGGRDVPYYAHPDMFRTRADEMPDGSMRPMEDVTEHRSARRPGRARGQHARAAAICWTAWRTSAARSRACTRSSAACPASIAGRSTAPAGSSTSLIGRALRRGERAGKGWSCSRPAPCRLINVLNHARECFGDVQAARACWVACISPAQRAHHPETVEALQGFDLDVIAAGHCTGWRAMTALANAFGDKKLTPLAVGKRLSF